MSKPNIGHYKPFVCNPGFSAGFTLTELAITLAIAGIVAAAAIPSMQSLVREQRLTGQTNEFIGDLTFARSEALKRGASIVVCKSTNPLAASPTCDPTDANPWTSGRVVFVDLDNDNVIDANEPILRVREPLQGAGNKLVGDGLATGTANRVVFTGNGTTLVPPGGGTENQVISCDGRGAAQGRAIAIRRITGRIRLTNKGADMNGAAISSVTCPVT